MKYTTWLKVQTFWSKSNISVKILNILVEITNILFEIYFGRQKSRTFWCTYKLLLASKGRILGSLAQKVNKWLLIYNLVHIFAFRECNIDNLHVQKSSFLDFFNISMQLFGISLSIVFGIQMPACLAIFRKKLINDV